MKTGRVLLLLAFLLLACNLPRPNAVVTLPTAIIGVIPPTLTGTAAPAGFAGTYHRGDPFPYIVQPGDTLAAVAARLMTTSTEIVRQNPFLAPADQRTTLSAGQTLSVRLDVEPSWERPTPILPDMLFINGPAQVDVDTAALINASNGWLKHYIDRSGGNQVTGAQIVNDIVLNYSISPRLILTILEFQLHALSDPTLPQSFSLGSPDVQRVTLGSQLSWAANTLNNGYYGWREGSQTQFSRPEGVKIIPYPGDNAASVALQYYFSRFLSRSDYLTAISANGLAQYYQNYFGQINWKLDEPFALIPADLKQPVLKLPFRAGLKWVYTGGPHTGWGIGEPRAGIDFAPPSEVTGCAPSTEWVVAVADGVVARSEYGVVILDLDGDGYVQTGWTVQYLHIFTPSAPAVGTRLKTGDVMGHPSCDGVRATGRHVHIARLYNGEWIPAGGILPFNLDGWVASQGNQEYQGSLTRGEQVIRSSIYGEFFSLIMADP